MSLTNTRREQLKEWRGVKVRVYPLGPLRIDVPLKVFDEDAADLRENIKRLRAAKSWWPERLLLVLTGVVFCLWMWRG